jgi:hypothetical protein
MRAWREKSFTPALSLWRGNNTQILMNNHSLVGVSVLKFNFILLPGLLLRAEKDKRMRLQDE